MKSNRQAKQEMLLTEEYEIDPVNLFNIATLYEKLNNHYTNILVHSPAWTKLNCTFGDWNWKFGPESKQALEEVS